MIFADYCEQELSEALKVKYVVRNGKRKKKWVTTKKGKYRVEYENGQPKEVRITAGERRRRKLGQRKGKLKRKAKVGIIELRRRKSFVARRNAGMQYNKKIPDIVVSRGPNGHIADTPEAKKLRDMNLGAGNFIGHSLHPVHESMLYESPHSYLFSDDEGVDYFWDFYSEIAGGSEWLQQVIDIYTKHEIVSIEKDANNSEFGDVIEIPPDYISEITENLVSNLEFLCVAARDFIDAPKELPQAFMDKVPAKLFMAMQPYIRKMELAK